MADEASRSPFQSFAGLEPGSVVAGYRVEGKIGAGGMAMVFRARDIELDRLVALKVLAPILAADEEFRSRFIRERRAITSVEHPHVIPVYAAGEAGDVLYIAMRLVSGGDLATMVRREGPLDPWRVAGFVAAAAAALDAVHAVGLVHRDVKPSNILIDSVSGLPDHVYLSDFGLSKGMMSSARLTGTGHFLGTPDFAAPEQISGKRVDGHTDQYALACVAFTLLTARPPFPRDEPMSVMFAHVQDPPPSVVALRPQLPQAVDQVIARGMAKSPADRYANCGEFAAALREATGTVPRLSGPTYNSPDLRFPAEPGGAGGSRDGVGLRGPGEPARPYSEASSHDTADLNAPTRLRTDTAPRNTAPPRDVGLAGSAFEPQVPRGTARQRSRHRIVAVGVALILAAGGAAVAFLATHNDGNTPGRAPSATVSSPRHPTAASSAGPTALPLSPVKDGAEYALAFNGDGNLAGIGFNDSSGFIYSWDMSSPQGKLSQFNGPRSDVALSADGSMVYGALNGTGTAHVWDTASGHVIASLPPSLGAISNTGIAALLASGTIDLWNVHAGKVTGTLVIPAGVLLENVSISPDGSTVAGTAVTGKVYIWTTRTGALSKVLPNPGPVAPSDMGQSSVFSTDGSTLAVDTPFAIYVWKLSGYSLVGTLRTPAAPSDSLYFLALDSKGNLAAVVTGSGSVNLVDIASGKVVRTITNPGYSAENAAFNSSDTKLAVGYGTANYIWSISG